MNKRDFLGALAGFCAAPLAFMGKRGEPKEEYEWNKTHKLAHERYVEHLKTLDKSKRLLKELTGWDESKCNTVYKAVAKHLSTVRDYAVEFATKVNTRSMIQTVQLWDAICITFRTAGMVDGFSVVRVTDFMDLVEPNVCKDNEMKCVSPLEMRDYLENLMPKASCVYGGAVVWDKSIVPALVKHCGQDVKFARRVEEILDVTEGSNRLTLGGKPVSHEERMKLRIASSYWKEVPREVFASIQGGLIDPIQPIWGHQGKWNLYKT